jgi:hypothetical protein
LQCRVDPRCAEPRGDVGREKSPIRWAGEDEQPGDAAIEGLGEDEDAEVTDGTSNEASVDVREHSESVDADEDVSAEYSEAVRGVMGHRVRRDGCGLNREDARARAGGAASRGPGVEYGGDAFGRFPESGGVPYAGFDSVESRVRVRFEC